nr:O-antigen ligase family protein [Bacilli bacterium]
MKKIEDTIGDILKLNMSKESVDKFNIYLIIFGLITMMIPKALYNFKIVEIPDLYNYFLFLLIPMVYIFIYNIKKKYHKNSIDFIFLTIFMVIVFVSSLHAFNPWIAFFGDASRKTGFLTYIIYYFIYINSKNINNKEDVFKILNIMFIIGIINTIFALLQSYLPYNNIFNKLYVNMAYGLIGNPNFLATFALLLLSLSLYISLFINNNKFYKIVSYIMFVCLVLSSSTGPFLTFILLLCSLFIYILIKKRDKLKKLIIYTVVFILLFIGIEGSSIYINQKIYKYEVKKTGLISKDITNIINIIGNKFSYKDTVSDNVELDYEYDKVDAVNAVSSGRLSLYKIVARYISQGNYIWLGTGPDNMNIYHIDWVDSNNRTTMTNYDKAHNVYLNVLAETGIFSLIVYIAWIVSYHLKTKKCKNELMYLLLFGLISYNIQGLFNIDVFMVMPYYFIIAGMLMGIGDKLETRKH